MVKGHTPKRRPMETEKSVEALNESSTPKAARRSWIWLSLLACIIQFFNLQMISLCMVPYGKINLPGAVLSTALAWTAFALKGKTLPGRIAAAVAVVFTTYFLIVIVGYTFQTCSEC
jgi:hypothetical protein